MEKEDGLIKKEKRELTEKKGEKRSYDEVNISDQL